MPRRAPRLVGRAIALGRLEAAFTEVHRGAVGVAVVEGDAGMGTSRLLGEFERSVRTHAAAVFFTLALPLLLLSLQGGDNTADPGLGGFGTIDA